MDATFSNPVYGILEIRQHCSGGSSDFQDFMDLTDEPRGEQLTFIFATAY